MTRRSGTPAQVYLTLPLAGSVAPEWEVHGLILGVQLERMRLPERRVQVRARGILWYTIGSMWKAEMVVRRQDEDERTREQAARSCVSTLDAGED